MKLFSQVFFHVCVFPLILNLLCKLSLIQFSLSLPLSGPCLPWASSKQHMIAMGSDQHFCLRWNNFHSNIATSFEHLRDHEDFVDVTLACEGRSLKAHKVVLSACSPYFRNLLKVSVAASDVLSLRVEGTCSYAL